MKFRMIIRLFAYAAVVCAIALQAAAQSETKILSVDYGKAYQLQDSYSIIYDNSVQTAKLKEFRVTFYNSLGESLAETAKETHPLAGKIETYSLSAPVSGFSKVELSILSLHSGDMEIFPSEIGGILALNELTEISEPEETQPFAETTPVVSKPDPVLPPALTAAEKQRMVETKSAAGQLLIALRGKTAEFASNTDAQALNSNRLLQLTQNIEAVSEQASLANNSDLKSQADTLNANIASDIAITDMTQTGSKLGALETEILAVQNRIKSLQDLSESEGADLSAVMSSLGAIEEELDNLDTSLAGVDLPQAINVAKIDAWESDYVSLRSQLDASSSDSSDWGIILAAVFFGLLLLGFGAKLFLGKNAKVRPIKSALHQTETAGVIFPASPMLAGNVAAPLSASGQLTAAQLQMLTGPYAVLREAYQATGRIGYAQEGSPTAEDYSFGTGFLISDRHVITNRHVHGLYGHYLLDKTDPGGIEFIAEKEKDASDFVPFKCESPLLLPALDIAIYTLARPVLDRTPIALAPIETDRLNGREIVVIGYPDTHTPEAEDIKAVVEENAIFAVKRISQGQIFRHSTDTDTPFGVETQVSEDKQTAFAMPAICHNASTLGGNSGSPLLDIKTGKLLGIHFAGFKVFNREEAANLAMAIAQLSGVADATSKRA